MTTNYLRIRKSAEIKAGLKHEQRLKRGGNHGHSNECPYCHSKNIEPCNTEKVCRNCHRHFNE